MDDLVPADPELMSERIRLRPFRAEDAPAIAEACQDADIARFTFMPEAMTEAQAERYVQRRLEQWSEGLHVFAVTLVPDGGIVGQVGVRHERAFRRAELFYWLDQRYRGRGLMSEALELATRWVLDDPQVVRAQLVTHLDNAASQRVAARCGYGREGVLRAWEPIKNDQPDMVMWSRVSALDDNRT